MTPAQWAMTVGLVATSLALSPVYSVAQTPALPGVGEKDARRAVASDMPPWRGIGRVQSGGLAGRCSGALIGVDTVLTAAHCLWSPRVQHMARPGAVHFLLRYSRGTWVRDATADSIQIAPGYDPLHPLTTTGSDWAVLHLPTPVGTPTDILPPVSALPSVGTKAMLGGYDQDMSEILTADTHCAIIALDADQHDKPLLHHSCVGTRGTSGAPLLVNMGGYWAVAGVQDAAKSGVAGGWASIPPATLWLNGSRLPR